MKKRKLDAITPSFRLTKEQIEDTKRVLTDPEYAKAFDEECRRKEKEQLARQKNIILTGTDEDGHVLPLYLIKRLKDDYEAVTGERLTINDK